MIDPRAATLAALLFAGTGAGAAAEPDAETLARGEYLARAGGCLACHSPEEGALPTGGKAVETPFGDFYPPNLTPDPDTGIGRWRPEDFRRAMREGLRPDGSPYYPSFPYTAYTGMRDADLGALWAYLRRLPATPAPAHEHDLPWYLFRPLVWGWRLLFFEPGALRPQPSRPAGWNNGAYLATAVAHCPECHTPRNAFGALRDEMAYAGTREGPGGEVVPNITPDRDTGIGAWSRDDLIYYLETGGTPDGDYAGGLMAEAIDTGLAYLSDADRADLADYLASLPPLSHRVRAKKKHTQRRDEFDY